MADFTTIIAFGVGLFVLVRLLRSRTLLRIEIAEGRATLKRGRAPKSFLRDVEEICAAAGVRCGTLTAMQGSHGTDLRFSREFSEASMQRIRNVWYSNPRTPKAP